jgi:diguanylate cyclase (GGDEF)-like protein
MNSMTPRARILVVDDQPANIQILAEALQQTQFDVLIANNGMKALQIAQESNKPDLILLDVMMSGLDGFEVCRRLKSDATTRNIPVIFVTAKNNASDEEKGLSIGAVDYISKPFSIPVVRARVRNHIQLKQRADLLEELASIDPLTHLPNRRLLENTLQEKWKWAQRDGSSLSILMVDIDHFKNYNDHYGHGAGDQCLQLVAEAMRSRQARPGDMVARIGGEEFIVILPNTDIEGARIAGERLRQRVEALEIPHAHSRVAAVVSISVGCATVLPSLNDSDATGLINAADSQLYIAKEQGRNRVI